MEQEYKIAAYQGSDNARGKEKIGKDARVRGDIVDALKKAAELAESIPKTKRKGIVQVTISAYEPEEPEDANPFAASE